MYVMYTFVSSVTTLRPIENTHARFIVFFPFPEEVAFHILRSDEDHMQYQRSIRIDCVFLRLSKLVDRTTKLFATCPSAVHSPKLLFAAHKVKLFLGPC